METSVTLRVPHSAWEPDRNVRVLGQAPRLQLPEAMQSLVMTSELQPAANTGLSERVGPPNSKGCW